jgi:hypothetical protein
MFVLADCDGEMLLDIVGGYREKVNIMKVEIS